MTESNTWIEIKTPEVLALVAERDRHLHEKKMLMDKIQHLLSLYGKQGKMLSLRGHAHYIKFRTNTNYVTRSLAPTTLQGNRFWFAVSKTLPRNQYDYIFKVCDRIDAVMNIIETTQTKIRMEKAKPLYSYPNTMDAPKHRFSFEEKK